MHHDHNGQCVDVGDSVRSLETNWHGKIIGIDHIDGDVMLKCQGINFWDQSLDQDDIRWFAPNDVVKAHRIARPVDGVNHVNMM